MNLVLCMAGLYQRFRNAGYTTPKFLLPWQEQTILAAVLELMLTKQAFSRLLLVANVRDQSHENTLHQIVSKHPIPYDILFIADTHGQAETARIGCDFLQKAQVEDERVIFHNVDTLLVGRDYHFYGEMLNQFDGLIDVFYADLPCYSYVSINEQHVVTKIAEKIVISSYATSGLYGFCSYKNYMQWMDAAQYQKEFYISDVYQAMLAQQKKIIAPVVTALQRTIVLGTPQEYEAAVGCASSHEHV